MTTFWPCTVHLALTMATFEPCTLDLALAVVIFWLCTVNLALATVSFWLAGKKQSQRSDCSPVANSRPPSIACCLQHTRGSFHPLLPAEALGSLRLSRAGARILELQGLGRSSGGHLVPTPCWSRFPEAAAQQSIQACLDTPRGGDVPPSERSVPGLRYPHVKFFLIGSTPIAVIIFLCWLFGPWWYPVGISLSLSTIEPFSIAFSPRSPGSGEWAACCSSAAHRGKTSTGTQAPYYSVDVTVAVYLLS